MPYSEKPFKVTIAERANAAPIEITFGTLEEAMRVARGLRAGLAPKEGGQVVVHDPEGRQLQAWIEHPLGGHFTHHGGFQA